MRIHRVSLTNYRGVSDCTVEFPDNGVTVIEGDNEVGKTSIPEAVNLILSVPADSGQKAVTAIRPVHRDVRPEVEVEITSGDYRFTYFKRWQRRVGETRLEVTAPSREQLAGREAHDRVKAILNETLDHDLWQALNIEQGTELGQPMLNVPSLGRALDQVAGGAQATDSDDALWDRICDERGKYWTRTGQMNQERKSLADQVDQALASCADLEAQIEAIEDDADKARQLAEAEPELVDTRREAESEEAELRELWDESNNLRAEVERLEASHDAALAEHREATGLRREREERIDTERTCREILTTLETEVEQAAPALALAMERKQQTEAALSAAREALSEAQQLADLAGADHDYHRNLISKDLLSERHERVITAQKDLWEAEEILDSVQVDDELATLIEKASLDVTSAQAALSASAPTVEATAILALGAHIDGVEVNLGAGEARKTEVVDSWELVVPDVVQVRVQAGSGASDLSTELQAAQERHDRLCSQGGVQDLAEARQKAEARNEAERRQKDAQATIERDLRDLTFEALAQKVNGLEKRTVAYTKDRIETPPLPGDVENAERVASDAEKSLGECQTKFEQYLEDDSQAGEDRQEAERTAAVDAERLNHARTDLERAEQKLQEDRQQQSDNALDETLTAAQAKAREVSNALEKAQEALQAQDPDTIETKLANARDVKARAEQALTDNRREQAKLSGRLEAQGGSGLHTQLNDRNNARESVERKRQSAEARAQAAELLHQTFKKHRQDARERYIGPFREKIEELGRIVFGPTFEVELDTDLRVAKRTLDKITLNTDQLSVGAREQIGVICRLACAAIVSPGGKGAPVVVDDALGWSDPSRLKSMGAAMHSASKQSQVIVLTCTPGRYAHVGNASVIKLD